MASESKRITKISAQIWTPLIDKLNEKLDAACLRRDAYISKVLASEIPALDEEVPAPNSDEARSLIANKLESLPRKLVSLSLPTDLVAQLNGVCARKNIVRDAFFNRLYFLLAAPPNAIDALYFGGSTDWRNEVWSEFKNDGPFFQNGFYPLEPEIDPFWAIRVGLDLTSNGDSNKEYLYTVVFDKKVGDADLLALSPYLPDWMIPGHPEQVAAKQKFDEFLANL